MLLVLLLAGCPTQGRVERAIEAARPCTADDECVDVGSVCPFGCSIAVNRSDAAAIRDLLQRYRPDCEYDCLAAESISCVEGLCTAVYADTGP